MVWHGSEVRYVGKPLRKCQLDGTAKQPMLHKLLCGHGVCKR